MTKSEFILSLSEALAHLPGSERVRVLEYYEEMIDDRVESGMAEEEAVAALGSIDEILREAAPEALNVRREYVSEMTAESGAKSFSFREPIETLIANSASAELHVRSAELPGGLTARVDYNLSENEQCVCSLENGTLKVQYKNLRQRGFSLRSLFTGNDCHITVTLANAALVRGELGASSGDIDLNGLVFTDSLEVRTASGNLEAHNIAVQRNCSLHTASGDITAKNLTCGDQLEVHTASGDADLFDVRTGKLSVGSASGDPTLGNIKCDDLSANAASGDITMNNIRAGRINAGTSSGDITLSDSNCLGTIELGSSSGDMEIQNTQCSSEIQLSSTSGDICGRLIPPENYRYSARSRSGDVRVPHYSGSCPVEIRTVSGDITFKAH